MANDGFFEPATSVLDDCEDASAKAAAVVRVSCVDGKLSRSMIGYGVDSQEAYRNAEAEAIEFCSDFGGVLKLIRL